MRTGLLILATLVGIVLVWLLAGTAIDLLFGLTMGSGRLIILGCELVLLCLWLGVSMEKAGKK